MAPADPDHEASLTREVGARLRAARVERGLSLRGLAQAVEVSPSLLSQIENGLARPSVGTLWAVVSELGVSLDRVFEGAGDAAAPATPDQPSVQRADLRPVIELSDGVRWEQLDAAHDPDVVFAFVTYEPGGQAAGRPHARHRGREYGYLVSGRLAIEISNERVELGPGDAVSFDSSTPHRFVAVGDEPARAVWFNVATERPVR